MIEVIEALEKVRERIFQEYQRAENSYWPEEGRAYSEGLSQAMQFIGDEVRRIRVANRVHTL